MNINEAILLMVHWWFCVCLLQQQFEMMPPRFSTIPNIHLISTIPNIHPGKTLFILENDQEIKQSELCSSKHVKSSPQNGIKHMLSCKEIQFFN